MPHPTDDLYQLLGVGRLASAADLRRSYEWCTSTRQTPQRRAAVQEAYAVLGDPRLRAEYDRGRVVGVGAGTYYRAGAANARPCARPSRLEQRWERRIAGACAPAARVPRAVTVVLVGLALAATAAGAVDTLRGGATPAAAMPAPVPQIAPPYAPTGACYAADGRPELRPAEPVSCDGPHPGVPGLHRTRRADGRRVAHVGDRDGRRPGPGDLPGGVQTPARRLRRRHRGLSPHPLRALSADRQIRLDHPSDQRLPPAAPAHAGLPTSSTAVAVSTWRSAPSSVRSTVCSSTPFPSARSGSGTCS